MQAWQVPFGLNWPAVHRGFGQCLPPGYRSNGVCVLSVVATYQDVVDAGAFVATWFEPRPCCVVLGAKGIKNPKLSHGGQCVQVFAVVVPLSGSLIPYPVIGPAWAQVRIEVT